MKCGICNRPVLKELARVEKLTETDKAYSRQLGVEPPDEYIYCGPCYRLIHEDKEAAARLIQGTLQANLKASGVANADQIAKRYYDALIKKAAPKPVS